MKKITAPRCASPRSRAILAIFDGGVLRSCDSSVGADFKTSANKDVSTVVNHHVVSNIIKLKNRLRLRKFKFKFMGKS